MLNLVGSLAVVVAVVVIKGCVIEVVMVSVVLLVEFMVGDVLVSSGRLLVLLMGLRIGGR